MKKEASAAAVTVLILLVGLAVGKLFDLLGVYQATIAIFIFALLAAAHIVVAAVYQNET